MHTLHKILVNVSEALEGPDAAQGNTALAIRKYAMKETEHFQGDVYCFRKTDSAGHWSSMYPDNVLLGSENPERLISELKMAMELQRDTVIDYAKEVMEWNNGSLEEVDCGKRLEKSPGKMLKRIWCVPGCCGCAVWTVFL